MVLSKKCVLHPFSNRMILQDFCTANPSAININIIKRYRSAMISMLRRTLLAALAVSLFSLVGGVSSTLQGQTWAEIATDGQGDGASPALNDGKSLSWYYNRATDTLWFRVEVYSPMATDAFGVNIVLDTDGNPNNGDAWWGSNGGFRYDKLITVWVTRSGQGYVGTIGVANPAGVAAGDYTNLFQNNMQVILDPSQNSYVIGIERSQIDDDGNMRAIAAVGSNQFWNDDIPNIGAGTIDDKGVQPAAVYSATAITFEQILVGESTNGSLTITAANEAGLEVTSIALTEPDDALTITTKPALPVTLAQGQELEVTVTYAPTESGFISADLLITTNDAQSPTQDVTLSGSTMLQWPRMSVPYIDFDVVEVGDTSTVPVTIYPLNRAGLTIGGLFVDTSSGGGSGHFSLSGVGTLPISLDESDSIVVQVSYHPQHSGRVDQAMIIQVLNQDGSLRDGDWVLLNGRAVDAVTPAATVSSDNVDFGEVKVGNTSSEAYVSIAAANAAGLEISSLSFQTGSAQDDGFSFEAPGKTFPLTLREGERLDLVLRFAPSAVGDVQATLRAATNAAAQPNIDIALLGKGVGEVSSVAEQQSNLHNLALFPNPVRGVVQCSLTLERSGALVLNAVDVNGRSVMLLGKAAEAGNQVHPVDLSGLAPGVWLLNVQFNGNIVGQMKFVVQ